MPRPLASTVSHSSDPQFAQAGSGGWRSVPHDVQCWMSRRWARAPSNQNALSCVSAGRGRGGRGGVPGAGVRTGGRYLRMRKRIVATGSPASKSACTCSVDTVPAGTSASGTATKSSRVVTKRPVPSPVRFGSEIASITERDQHPVPHHQRSPVLLLAVGGHHRGQPLVVEQAHHARRWARCPARSRRRGPPRPRWRRAGRA